MFHHQNFECGDTAINNRRKCRTLASVGQTNGKMSQNVNDMASDTLFQNRGKFCANPGQTCRGSK
jgi:hypothetical protein